MNAFEIAELRVALNAAGRSSWTTGRLPEPDGVLCTHPPNHPPFGFMYNPKGNYWIVGMLTMDFDGLLRGKDALQEVELAGQHKSLTAALDAIERFMKAGGALRLPMKEYC